jgi:Uma2 family endonuclease
MSAAVRSPIVPLAQPAVPVPPLENGERMTRAEFERRYDRMPGVQAELIEGKVYVASPVKRNRHSVPNASLVYWLTHYQARTPGTEAGTNGSVRLDLDNMPQPDAYLLILPSHGGASRLSDDDYVEGAVELAAEVANTSASIDLHEKLQAYRRNGVAEYVVWRISDAAIDYFAFDGADYVRVAPDELGVIRSRVFPGLWLNVPALIARDLKAVAATVEAGLATPEHAAFAASLVAKTSANR